MKSIAKMDSKITIYSLIGLIFFFTNLSKSENGVTEKEIIFGTIRNQNSFNNAAFQAAKSVFDERNRKGGVFGRNIKLIEKEDKSNGKISYEIATALIDKEKIFSFFQTEGTQITKSGLFVAEKSDTPFMFPLASGNFLSYPNKRLVFNLRARYWDEAQTMIGFANKKNLKKIALVIQPDAVGIDQRSGLEKALGEKSSYFTSVTHLSQDSSDAQIEKALSEIFVESPELVIIGLPQTISVKLINSANLKNNKTMFFCYSSVNADTVNPNYFQEKTKNTHNQIYLFQSIPIPVDSELPIAKEYREYFKNAEQSTSSFEGFLNAKVTLIALEKVGKDLTRSRFINALESMHDFDLGGFKFSFDPKSHQGIKTTTIYQLIDNKLKKVNPL